MIYRGLPPFARGRTLPTACREQSRSAANDPSATASLLHRSHSEQPERTLGSRSRATAFPSVPSRSGCARVRRARLCGIRSDHIGNGL